MTTNETNGNRRKNPPLRSCVGCRKVLPKSSLVRFVRSPDNAVAVDHSQTAPGRGAYVCQQEGCLKLAHQRRAFSRALKGAVEVPDFDHLWALVNHRDDAS